MTLLLALSAGVARWSGWETPTSWQPYGIIWQRLVLDFTKLNRGRDFGTVRGVYPCPDGGKLERIDRIMSTDSLWRRGYKY